MNKQTGMALPNNKLKFKHLFLFELKHHPGLIVNILAIVMILFALLAVHNSAHDYNQLLKQEKEFKKIEDLKIKKYVNYRLYGIYGIRITFRPVPIYIFFNQSAVLPAELTATMDSGERLKVYYPFQGKNVFLYKKNNYSDFSGVIVFFGTLLALLYGFEGYNKKEYLQFLASCSRKRALYSAIFLARFIKLSILFFFLLTVSIGIIYINGIIIPYNNQLVLLFALILLNMLFFFALGTSIMTIKSRINGFIVILICWYICLFFSPNLIQSIIARKAGEIQTIYNNEIKKLEILADFEKKILESQGAASNTKKTTQQTKEMIQSYLNTTLKKIIFHDKKQNANTYRNILLFQKLSQWYPTTFFNISTNELSSLGYENLMEFYNYIIQRKERFVRFILNKIYFENFSTVISFEEGKSNVLAGTSRLPKYFLQGVTINLLYIVILIFISYYRFHVLLYRLSGRSQSFLHEEEIRLSPGMFKEWAKEGEDLKNQLYSLLSGERGALAKREKPLKLIIRDIDLSLISGGIDFLYLCHSDKFPPTLTVGNLISLMFTSGKYNQDQKENIINKFHLKPVWNNQFNSLNRLQAGEISLAIMHIKKVLVHLVDDISNKMPIEFHIFLKEKIDILTSQQAIVLLFISNPFPANTNQKLSKDIIEGNIWSSLVERLKKQSDRNGGKSS